MTPTNKQEYDPPMDPALQLQPGQEKLTPAQEAEARRFAEGYIHRQLSTEPVDEREAEALLCQAYQVAGLDPPQRIHWLDGPLHMLAILPPFSAKPSLCWDSIQPSIWDSARDSIQPSIVNSVWTSVWGSARISVWLSVGRSIWDSVKGSGWVGDESNVSNSVKAYEDASWFACASFFWVYLAPSKWHAFARFNERVSGYWLGQEEAYLVRHPRMLACDQQCRLHSATGKCIEYRDGWGFYAWHGVLVPERVILAPEELTRKDFLNETNVEVRRVMQERMGQERFVHELGGVEQDTSPRGTLYEVRLPAGDPERVARYVQVQDASTERRYFLRVPPTMQTAAEAVAWTFQAAVETYAPTQET